MPAQRRTRVVLATEARRWSISSSIHFFRLCRAVVLPTLDILFYKRRPHFVWATR
jgi:hypothetical protein